MTAGYDLPIAVYRGFIATKDWKPQNRRNKMLRWIAVWAMSKMVIYK